ncbi:MAG: RNA ligase family protein [Planctomycetota bacterium]|nr:RNA ligase family protein [Planctomycetota bacterium]
MSEFKKWHDIGGLHNVLKYLKMLQSRCGATPPTVRYRAKIKLHGTNAGVRLDSEGAHFQSRNRDLSLEADNSGFYAWASQYDWQCVRDLGEYVLVIYGEWAGPGVNGKTSLKDIPEKTFFIFGAEMTNPDGAVDKYFDEDELHGLLSLLAQCDNPPPYKVLPWAPDSEIAIDLNSAVDVAKLQNLANDMVEQVEVCDPYVKETFGVEGNGEGYVWYADVNGVFDPKLLFKAKGAKHQGKKAKVAVEVDVEVLKSIEEFVETFVTTPRCEQGLTEACGDEFDIKKTGVFIGWVCKDVAKESKDELETSDLTWKQVSAEVVRAARTWYLEGVQRV